MLAWIVASTVALSAVDLRVRCLPTRMVWTMGSGLAVLAVPEALVDPVAVHREALAGLLLASAVALIVVVVRSLRGGSRRYEPVAFGLCLGMFLVASA